VTERSEQAAEIAFAIVLIAIVAGMVVFLFVDSGDTRAAVAGFVGGIISVLAVGVARWIGGSKNQPAKGDRSQPRTDERGVQRLHLEGDDGPDHEQDHRH
jgi:hypothetical protein